MSLHQKPLYAGKSKSVFTTEESQVYRLLFKDDATAFNAKIHKIFSLKGKINNLINEYCMGYFAKSGIATHFIKRDSGTTSLVKKLEMLPLEFICRNRAAGSFCKRFGVEEGRIFSKPLVEIGYKSDVLGDPFMNTAIAQELCSVSPDTLESAKAITLKINQLASELLLKADLILVDFKLEFGLDSHGALCLGDEFSPDGCRLWDSETLEVFDKDVFRKGITDLSSQYTKLLLRLGVVASIEELERID